jgi:hypothetical protein
MSPFVRFTVLFKMRSMWSGFMTCMAGIDPIQVLKSGPCFLFLAEYTS